MSFDTLLGSFGLFTYNLRTTTTSITGYGKDLETWSLDLKSQLIVETEGKRKEIIRIMLQEISGASVTFIIQYVKERPEGWKDRRDVASLERDLEL